MAGSNNLYLEPIINGAVGDMGANISAMNTQLSETTRILMNILNNQGLEQHQAVYSGAAFAALTITGDTTPSFNITPSNEYATITGPDTIEFAQHAGNDNGFETVDETNCNLTNVTQITIKNTGQTAQYVQKIILTDSDGITTITPTSHSGVPAVAVFDIPEENRKQYTKIFMGEAQSIASKAAYTITYVGGTFTIKEIVAAGFNSNNILTLVTSNQVGCPAAYTATRTVYLTIPDIQGVANWVSCLLKGNLSGVSVALVDSQSHDIIKVLETATADLSDLNVFTDIALMVTFAAGGNGTNYISGFTMRYY